MAKMVNMLLPEDLKKFEIELLDPIFLFCEDCNSKIPNSESWRFIDYPDKSSLTLCKGCYDKRILVRGELEKQANGEYKKVQVAVPSFRIIELED
ncbi:hypothetical protein A2Z67_00135 [Candidatus Woesebacteria bacterium RBG_13_36_22]|uniref:Uncharacterized protein n=1 Tax=Candidatus Woesebacteria bacterium RBG_13_36_22 TaxID=1802478 RepID=A0A1F7X7F1_9BACT|nr:MAG: hypothetical protein A2Z67_00135 [Candidatus Woesebacteria bacterium RBG_13_36_22]